MYGEVLFKDGSILEFLELIGETHKGLERLISVSVQKGQHSFRCNARIKEKLIHFPHVHVGGKVLPSKEEDLEVLKEIEDIL